MKSKAFQDKVNAWSLKLLAEVKNGVKLGQAAFDMQADANLSTEDLEALSTAVDEVQSAIIDALRPIY